MTGNGTFRCAYFSRHYERAVAFYGEGLELPVAESWDRGPDDRGTIFEAAAGRVEVLALPARPEEPSVWDHRPPAGVTLVVEVDDVAALWERYRARGLPVAEPLCLQPWGHRSFVARDPDGLSVYCFAPVDRAGSG